MAETDTRARDGTSADRKITITQTAAVLGSGATGVIALMYAIACIKAHALLSPTQEQGLALLAIGGPFFHLLGRIVMYWTSKLLPKDANT